MSTYEELQLITSVALLIVAILTYTHKKYRPALAKLTTIFSKMFAGAGEVHSPSGCLVKYIIPNIRKLSNVKKAALLPAGTALT